MEYLRRVIHIRATSRTRVGRRMNGQDYQLALLQPRFLMTRPALAYLSDAFEALLNEQTLERKEIFERLPEIHWLLSHIMPFQRGSASITDALTKIILLEKGQPLYLWKEGITPDPEAFLTDFEVYQKAYTSFFEANPLSLPSED